MHKKMGPLAFLAMRDEDCGWRAFLAILFWKSSRLKSATNGLIKSTLMIHRQIITITGDKKSFASKLYFSWRDN